MGLGPPVCVDCGVIGYLDDRNWRCPNCNDDNLKGNLWKLGIEESKQVVIRSNILLENKGQSFPDK